MKKKAHKNIKSNLHPRNKHRERYQFEELIKSYPRLKGFVSLNKYGDESIDFADPKAVKALNKALLLHFYKLEFWDIPRNYLCPPVPGRADYIHYIADLLCTYNFGKHPKGEHITGLDIGMGANCIYPIIGCSEYGWSFIGSEIDQKAFESAQKIVESNPQLKIDCRLQSNPKDFFYGILDKNEIIDFTVCNPPFHASKKEAEVGSLRKLSNLGSKKVSEVKLNFGGQSNELWCDGGEKRFVNNMIKQSKKFAKNCFLFTSLISKQSTLRSVYKTLEECDATISETIEMGQGNKTSRLVAWSFLSKAEQMQWKKDRWLKT